MNKFKVGDKVRRIACNVDDMTIGSVWVVSDIDNVDDVIAVVGLENEWWNPRNFELVSDEDVLKRTLMNSGDGGVVKCEVVDNVNSPNHYSSQSIECIVAMEAMLSPEEFIGYLRGNIFKYQWRYKQKNGLEDLKKAQWYQNKLIEKEGSK